MYDNSFRRVEEKYLLNDTQKDEFLAKIDPYIKKDKFFKSEIHNIYFDTDNNDLIINSLNKPIFKDKFRVRSYGIPSLNDDVFLEVKIKYKGMVGKRRTKIKLKDFYNYLYNREFDKDDQIFSEIDYYFNYYKLKPAIYIAYDRCSYKGKKEDDLRITFDTNLRSRKDNLKFKKGVKMVKYSDEDFYIMEIKTIEAMPIWLVRVLSEMNIMPTSFSKYGKIYEKEMNFEKSMEIKNEILYKEEAKEMLDYA